MYVHIDEPTLISEAISILLVIYSFHYTKDFFQFLGIMATSGTKIIRFYKNIPCSKIKYFILVLHADPMSISCHVKQNQTKSSSTYIYIVVVTELR